MDGDPADEDGDEAHQAHNEIDLAAYLHVRTPKNGGWQEGTTHLTFAKDGKR
jgi:hypothetical protein